jgi:hypothetical protein
MRRKSLVFFANTMPFYIRDLSICELGYLGYSEISRSLSQELVLTFYVKRKRLLAESKF